jgi:hypothetical protein
MGATVTTPAVPVSAPEPYFLDSLPHSGPPQKRRTWLIVLVIVLALTLVGIVGYVAIIGSTRVAINVGNREASAEASQSQPGEGDRNAPRKVKPGKAFTIGSHKTLAGWKVKRDTSLGGAHFNVTGKVKNIGDDTSTALIHFKFLDSSGELLGTVQCNFADLKSGQTQALNCIPDGKYGKYKRVAATAS